MLNSVIILLSYNFFHLSVPLRQVLDELDQTQNVILRSTSITVVTEERLPLKLPENKKELFKKNLKRKLFNVFNNHNKLP